MLRTSIVDREESFGKIHEENKRKNKDFGKKNSWKRFDFTLKKMINSDQ